MSRTPREISEFEYFHIMVRGCEHKKIFIDDMDKEKILQIMKRYSDENILLLIAYCILDTHAHFLIKVMEQDLSTIMKKINVSYAYYYNNKYQCRGHVFYDRFQSACIENNSYLLAVMRYIHNNPLSCGYAREQKSYKWSSFTEYTQNIMYLSNKNVLIHFGKTYDEAMKNFIQYAKCENNDIFLDVEESIDHKINMIIEEYLRKYKMNVNELGYKQNKVHRINLVLMMRDTGKLSIRKIADLLHLNRGTVYKILKEHS